MFEGLIHKSKVKKAYARIVNMAGDKPFPEGVSQANSIICSIAVILGLDIDKQEEETYFEILSIYEKFYNEKTVKGKSDDEIFDDLLLLYKALIKDDRTAVNVFLYCTRLKEDPEYCLESKKDVKKMRQEYRESKEPTAAPSVAEKGFDKFGVHVCIFDKYYRRIVKLLKKSDVAENIEFEVLPTMYVLCDLAAYNAEKDRDKVAEEVNQYINSYVRSDRLVEIYADRLEFYGDILQGKPLRAEWLNGETYGMEENIIARIAIALGDILINPRCANNYESAAVMFHDNKQITNFAEIMCPKVMEEMNEFFQEIIKAEEE